MYLLRYIYIFINQRSKYTDKIFTAIGTLEPFQSVNIFSSSLNADIVKLLLDFLNENKSKFDYYYFKKMLKLHLKKLELL